MDKKKIDSYFINLLINTGQHVIRQYYIFLVVAWLTIYKRNTRTTRVLKTIGIYGD
jgi:hypothetical protein